MEKTGRLGRTRVVLQTLMKISSPCIAFISLTRHFTSSSSFHQHSAEMCTITHPPPLTLTEEPRRRFYQNNLWASGPPGEQGWQSAALKKKKPSRSGGGGPDEEPSYVLNQVLQVIVNVLVFQALLGREGPGKDSRAAAFKVETAINCVCVCVCHFWQ